MLEAVEKLNFRKLLIFRPSILDGNRLEQRVGEKIGLVIVRFVTQFILKKYKPTPVDVLAGKMIRLATDKADGFRVVEGAGIFES